MSLKLQENYPAAEPEYADRFAVRRARKRKEYENDLALYAREKAAENERASVAYDRLSAYLTADARRRGLSGQGDGRENARRALSQYTARVADAGAAYEEKKARRTATWQNADDRLVDREASAAEKSYRALLSKMRSGDYDSVTPLESAYAVLRPRLTADQRAMLEAELEILRKNPYLYRYKTER